VTKGDLPFLTPLEALQDLDEFISYFEILYPSAASHQKLSQLVSLNKPKGLRIHDFEMASIALVNGVSTIATFNKSDFKQIMEISLAEDN
jgi:hypothetical protein